MININKKKIILICIFLLAAVLRFAYLSSNRPSLTNDEAAIGYNAYSIMKTARDEHGEFMPVLFKSFGDWKPGLYIYTVVPSVAIFGLTEFAIRAPSAFFGVLAVVLLYLLSKKLFKNETQAIFAAFFLSINPWHIHFSRGGWEANLSLTLTLAAIYFFLLSFKKNKYLYLSAFFFALTLWAYQSAKLSSSLILLGLLIFYKDKIFKIKIKKLLLAGLLGFVLSVPILLSVTSEKGGRLAVMSLFSYARSSDYLQETIYSQGNTTKNSLVFSLFHSENYNFTRGAFGRYFNLFAGRYLFFEGDWAAARHTSPNIGYFLLADSFLLILGLVYVARKKSDKNLKFLWFWLAVSPLPSALSRDSVHGIRSLNMVIPLTIFISFGAYYVFNLLKNKNLFIKYFIYIIIFVIYTYNFLFYLDAYYVHAPFVDANQYHYGYKQVVEKVTQLQKTHKKIVMNQSFDQPYIFFLLYQKYDPKKFQQNNFYVPTNQSDVGLVTDLDNIKFRDVNWSADKHDRGLILVGRDVNFPLYELDSETYKYEKILYPNGTTSFIILEVL